MAQTDILRWTSQLHSEGELVRKKQFFCIASNNTRNSLIVLFYPIHELTRKYAKLQSIILRPKVTLVYATSCVKQRFHFNSRLKFDNMNLGERNVTLTHRKEQMSVETFFYFDVIVECDRST